MEDFPLVTNVFLLAPPNQLQCIAVLLQREDLPILLDYLHELLQVRGKSLVEYMVEQLPVHPMYNI